MMMKALKLTGALALLFLLGVGGFFSWLGTPGGSAFLLEKINRVLAQKGRFNLSYTQAQINPWSKIHFENVKFSFLEPPNEVQLEIQSFHLNYHLNLFQREIRIEDFRVEKPRVKLNWSVQPPQPSSSSLRGNGQGYLEFGVPFLRKIQIKKMEVRDVELDLNIRTTELETRLTLNRFKLETEMNMESVSGRSQGRFGLEKDGILEIYYRKKGAGHPPVQLRSDCSGSWEVNLVPSQKKITSSQIQVDIGLQSLGKSPVKVDWKTRVEISDGLRKLKSVSSIFIDSAEVSTVRFDGETMNGQKASLNAKLEVLEKGQIRNLAKALQLKIQEKIQDVGPFKAKCELRAGAQGTFQTVLDLAQIDLARNLLDWNVDGGFEPLQSTTALLGPIVFNLKGETLLGGTHGAAQTNYQVTLPRVTVPVKKGKMAVFKFQDSGSLAVDLGFKKWTFEMRPKFQDIELGNIQTEIERKSKSQMTLSGDISLRFGQPLLKEIMRWRPDLFPKSIAFKNFEEILFKDHLESNADLESSQYMLKGEASLVQSGPIHLGGTGGTSGTKDGIDLDLIFAGEQSGGLKITHRSELKMGKFETILRAALSDFQIGEFGKIGKTVFDMKVEAEDFVKSPNELYLEGSLKQQGIQISPKWTKGVDWFSDLDVEWMVSSRKDGQINLEFLEGRWTSGVGAVGEGVGSGQETPRALVRLSMDANGNPREELFQAQGLIDVIIPKNFPVLRGHRVFGKMEMPWSFAISRRDYKFEGDLTMEDFGWSSPSQFGFSELQGTIPISEKFFWDGKTFQFSGLLTENPFERADFSRIQPLLQDSSMFKIEKLIWEDKVYGPFLGFFSIKQNRLLSHQFNLNLDRGLVYGEFYLDFLPSQFQVGVLSRISGLDLSKILPGKYLLNTPGGNNELGGRSGLVFNLRSGAINGRMDVTELGGTQLITLINVLDPKLENEKLNKLRSLLEIGYPTLVELSFAEGFVDMNIKLEVLGAHLTQNLRGIPISNWVASYTGGILK